MAAEGQQLIPKEAFETIDSDKDGLISKEETEQLVKQLQLNLDTDSVEKLFMDAEGTVLDKITYDKFVSLIQAEA